MRSFISFSEYVFLSRLFIFVAIILCLFSLYAGFFSPVYDYVENRVWNFYQRTALLYSSNKSQTVIVDIDENSLRQQGQWPWSREKIAELARILLSDYKAAAVAFDIWFTEDSKDQGDIQLLQLAKQYPIIFSQAFALPGQGSAVRSGYLGGGVAIPQDVKLPKAIGYIANNAVLATAPCIGHITPKKDFDGVSRIPLFIEWGQKAYPILGLEILRCLMHDNKPVLRRIDTSLIRYNKISISQNLGDKSILALDKDGYWKVPYIIPLENFTAIPVNDIFNHKVPPSLLQNQIVIVGSSATTLGDQHSTPQSVNVAGITVHAQMLEWMLSDSQVTPREQLEFLAWAWALISLLILYIFLIKRFSVFSIVLSVILFSVFWLMLGYVLWLYWQWWLPVLPIFAYILFTILQIPVEWSLVQRDSRYLKALFSGYLPPTVFDSIVKNGSRDVLQPKRQQLTILFADIADFTQRAESSTPESITALTQEILECLTYVVHEQRGTLDKYMGDAVMAFWNAPLSQKDHADLAVQAGLNMIEAVQAYNKTSALLQGEIITIRIGIHTGDVVVGNLGTKLRKAYTAIGDAVNVSARLQEKAKGLKQYLLVSEDTYILLKKNYPLKEYSKILLRGRKQELGVYVLSV